MQNVAIKNAASFNRNIADEHFYYYIGNDVVSFNKNTKKTTKSIFYYIFIKKTKK